MGHGVLQVQTIEQLGELVSDVIAAERRERIIAVAQRAVDVGRGGPRALEVAGTLASVLPDPVAVEAALFLPLEDTEQAEEVAHLAGDVLDDSARKLLVDVGRIEASLARLQRRRRQARLAGGSAGASAGRDVEALRQMLLAMAEDTRAVLLVLGDRLRDLRHVKDLPAEEARALAEETLDIYAPLANRLGIWQLKWELEDLAFRTLEPELYRDLGRQLAARRAERTAYVELIRRILSQKLAEVGIEGRVYGRPKHIYSIYRKMVRKSVSFEEVYDTNAVRVIVGAIEDCYAVLGIVHSLWEPVPGEFDDYIAAPKPNGYQSLHTAVVGPEGKHVEIQVRTEEMHRVAEFGVATHWLYKEAGSVAATARQERIARLRQLLAWGRDVQDAGVISEEMRREVVDEEVFVFTPAGGVRVLPKGATVLDFAYAIHTNVGHRCRGALLNGRLVPLTTKIQTGDVVEVLTKKHPQPSRDWLIPERGYLQSRRARAKVRSWFRKNRRHESIGLGRAVVERELKRLGATSLPHDELARLLRRSDAEDLYAALGYGDLREGQLTGAIQRALQERRRDEEEKRLSEATDEGAVIQQSERDRQKERRRRAEGASIRGVKGLLTFPAGCCQPVPGDDVIGFVTRGRGIAVHRRRCANIRRVEDPDRLVEVEWIEASPSPNQRATIIVEAEDRAGLIRDLAAALGDEGTNIRELHARARRRGGPAVATVRLGVRDREHLASAMRRVQAMPGVLRVSRPQG